MPSTLLLTQMHCALRHMRELFVNLFLKKNPHATKYFYERLNRNVQVLLEEISQKSIQSVYFLVIYYLGFECVSSSQ